MLRSGRGLSLSRRRNDDMIISVAGGTAPPDSGIPIRKKVIFMSDFEMLYLMLTLGLLIVGILNLTNKK